MHCAQTSKPFSRTPKLSLSQTLRSLPQTAPRLPSACYHAAVDSPFVLLRPPTTHGAPVPRCTSTMVRRYHIPSTIGDKSEVVFQPALIRPPPCLEWLLAVPVGHYPLNPRSAHRSGRVVTLLAVFPPCSVAHRKLRLLAQRRKSAV